VRSSGSSPAALRRLHDSIVTGAIGASTASAAAEPASRAVQRTSLPDERTPLIGRDEEVARAVEAVTAHPLVTLIGTGGVGKTRLALAAAHRLADAGEVIWCCELAPAGADDVANVLATVIGVDDRVGTDLVQRITEALRAERGVLVLDNCEHVVERAAEVVGAILRRCPGVRVLATSRERLAVDGERLQPVAPFPVGTQPSRDDPAVRLFEARGVAVRPEFALDESTLPVVAQICRRLDGLPLAIELAAARLQAIDLAQIAAGLDQRFRLLTSGSRSSPRQRSLAAAVAWSHDLLDPPLRASFDALGVFAGAFTTRGAARVLAVDETEATVRLAALVERSLVQRAHPGRWVLLETLKQFALERLHESGRLDELRMRHASWTLELVEGAAAQLAVANDDGPLREVDEVLAELRVAHRFLVGRRAADEDLRLVVALEDHAFFRMRPEVLSWAEDAARLGREDRHPMTPDALATAALAAWKRGDIGRAARLADEGRALTEELGLTERCLVANMIGVHRLSLGDLAGARHWFDRALAAEDCRTHLVRRIVVATDRLLASAFDGSADAPALADALLAALPPGPTVPGAYAWYGAAEAAAPVDEDLALVRARRALDEAAATGAWFVTGVAGALTASIGARSGDPNDAAETYRWLLPWWRRAGEWSVLWNVLRSMAILLERLDRPEASALLLGAVTADTGGHAVFGDDARRLHQLAVRLDRRLGPDVAAAIRAEGASLDVEQATDAALAELDRVG